jgi:hypothetical protein
LGESAGTNLQVIVGASAVFLGPNPDEQEGKQKENGETHFVK